MVPRILLWMVSHVLHPKNDGFSRIDNSEIHLVYIFFKEIQIGKITLFLECSPLKTATKELHSVMYL